MGIGEVVKNEQARKEIPSITCPHWGKTFQTKDDH